MSFALATLCLNEIEHLSNLYNQHKNWPGLTHWIFVEAVDAEYKKANPNMVSVNNKSVDGTSEFLKELAIKDTRVTYIDYGLSVHTDPAQGKIAPRQCYLDLCKKLNIEFLYILDADEFYTTGHQKQIYTMMINSTISNPGFCFRFRHIWRPPSIQHVPLMTYEATGNKFFDMTHVRGWRVHPNSRYYNHNHIGVDGMPRVTLNYSRLPNQPQCIHLGYCSYQNTREAKNKYYVERGEGITDTRSNHVRSRSSYSSWKSGDMLPDRGRVIVYNGPIPEVFLI